MFGPGFGCDAFNLFMNTRGQYVGHLASGNGNGGGGGMGGFNPMLMMMMMSGGAGNMAQMMPFLMQNQGGGNSQMNEAMMMMMMGDLRKQQEKKEKQEQFDQMMNMMMLKMIGGTMDSRQQTDATSGQFMVQEVVDPKDRSVKERHLIPMGMAMQNPMLMGGYSKVRNDETTQLVLKNALDEKSKAWELMAQSNQPLNQIFMTLLGNFQSKNDPINQFGQLMEIRDKYMGGVQGQIDPELEKIKFDYQMAMRQQDFQLKQMEHNWDLEKEEKKMGANQMKDWMGMISDLGGKLAGPITSVIASGMGKGGIMNAAGGLGGAPTGPGGLPPLGTGPQPPRPGDLSPPQMQMRPRQPNPGTDGPTFGVPDPDHNEHLLGGMGSSTTIIWSRSSYNDGPYADDNKNNKKDRQ